MYREGLLGFVVYRCRCLEETEWVGFKVGPVGRCVVHVLRRFRGRRAVIRFGRRDGSGLGLGGIGGSNLGRRIIKIKVPYFGRVVCGARCEVLDIRGEKNASEVVLVRLEGTYRNDARYLSVLDHAPDVDITL